MVSGNEVRRRNKNHTRIMKFVVSAKELIGLIVLGAGFLTLITPPNLIQSNFITSTVFGMNQSGYQALQGFQIISLTSWASPYQTLSWLCVLLIVIGTYIFYKYSK